MITRALKPAKENIADHYSGKHTLDQEKVKTMEKRIATFEEKITNLSKELSEEVSGRHNLLFCAKWLKIVSANTLTFNIETYYRISKQFLMAMR
jgi:lipopolysaccharide export LptBFGC system permease protein LptF